jgi:nucleoside-diphosphate-sugar epimerase
VQQIVLVTGASGFVGRAVVDALLKKGHRVRAFVRSESSPLPEHPNLTRAVGDVRDLHALEGAMAGVTAVVHLAAAKNDERDSRAINVHGAENVIEACRIAGVKRVINISTQSAKLQKKGLYGSTKEGADRLFSAAPLSVTTLRSSLIYGDMESGIFGTIIRYSRLPVVPLIGNGRATFRPIHRDDLAALIVHALEHPETAGKTYDIGGPDVLDLNTLTQKIMNARDVHRPVIHLPIWFSLIAAKIFSPLPHPPVTVSNVLGGAVDTPMNMDAMRADFGAVPVRSFAQGMEELFGATMTQEEREAKVLLRYVLAPLGDWQPDRAAIALCLRAFKAHGLQDELLDEKVLRSKLRLGAADIASRIRLSDSVLQRKLLVAAAAAECQPATADVLLPQERTLWSIFLKTIDLCAGALWKLLFALPYLLSPSTLKRDAGAL